MKHVFIDLEASNTSTQIAGSCTLTFVITEAGDQINLELVEKLTVNKVWSNGIETTFQHSNDLLTIELKEPKTDLQTIKVEYAGEPNPTEQTSKGISNNISNAWGNQITWTLSEPFHARYWWPAKQELNDKIDSIRIHITAANHLKVGSNGLLEKTVNLGNDQVRYEWVSHYPIAYYLLAFTVGEYVEYNNYAYPTALVNDSILIQNFIYNNPETLDYYQTQLDEFPKMVELFSELFGRYPFANEKYGHVMAPFGGGMEHQTMSTMGVFTFGLNAHELGHQWFGDHVTCGSWQDIWINEGFARFCEYIAAENILSTNNYYALVEDDILSVTGTDTGSIYIPEAQADDENRIFNFRLTYAKGGLVVNMIRHVINDDDLFFSTLRTYLSRKGNTNATGEDFKLILEEQTGMDFTSFFNEWYYGEGHPIFDIDWYVDQQKNLQLKISQTTTDHISLFTTPLEFEVRFSDGTSESFRVRQSQNEESFTIPMSKQVTGLTFDPKGWLIKKVNSTQQLDENGNLILSTPNEEIQIWPNPTNSHLFLSKKLENIQVFNADGKRLLNLSTSFNQLDLQELPAGMYLITGEYNNQIMKFKVMKK